MSASKFYITTAMDYPNSSPHIGHAYEKIIADAMARFKRCDGQEVRFVTGTDEYGLKILQTATQAGCSPADLVAENSSKFRHMNDELNISYDCFLRTTDPRHHETASVLWRRLGDKGDIYKSSYEGWYSVRDEMYFSNDETALDSDGIRRSVVSQSEVQWIEEESYFFRLSRYQDRLLQHYETNPNFICPEARRNEVIKFVQGGLMDLSVSRSKFHWGIPVPDDPSHVLYVWLDALASYLTGVELLNADAGGLADFWPANLHVIGKDITRFHAVYWPAFLMSAGLPVPKQIFAHGFILSDGAKMSKSLGNVIDPMDLASTYGIDQTRFFFLREISSGNDGNYSDEAMIGKINSDLANDLGNLVQRALSMIARNCGGILPVPDQFTPEDCSLLDQADLLLDLSRTAYDAFAIHKSLEGIWSVILATNKYFTAEAPWVLSKTDLQRMKTVLYVTSEVIRKIALLLQPVMPSSSSKILDLLGQDETSRQFSHFRHMIEGGITLPAPVPVFPRNG